MDESYVAALIAVWEEVRAALGDRFATLAPELSARIETYLNAPDRESAAQAEVAVEDWIASHAPALDSTIRLQMILAMDAPAVSFDLESLGGRTHVDWQRILQSIAPAVDTGASGSKGAASTTTSKGMDTPGDAESAAAAIGWPVPSADAPAQSPNPPISDLQSPISHSPLITRYTDIACPRRVWVEAPRLTVTVQLTVDLPTRSAAVSKLDVRPDAPVAIRLTAPAFDALNATDQATEILPDADSPPVLFHLKPRVAGPAQLVFDFRQAGNPVGTAVVDIDVTPYEVAAAPEARGGFALAMPQGIDAPDLLLYIHYDTSAGVPQLRFTLDEPRRGLATPFEPVPLLSDPATYAADLYRSLSRLAAEAGGDADNAALQAEIADEVRRLGYKVWRLLIPSGLKDLYLANRTAWQGRTLLVISDEPHIPWELAWPHDTATGARDDAPWSVSLRLLRWLRRDAVSRGYGGPAAALPFQAVACVAPTNTGLHLLEAERSFVLGLLAARAPAAMPARRRPRAAPCCACCARAATTGCMWSRTASRPPASTSPAPSNWRTTTCCPTISSTPTWRGTSPPRGRASCSTFATAGARCGG